MPGPAAHVLRTSTGPDTLAAVHDALEQVWAAHPVPEAVRLHLDLATGEIAANIVEHGGSATLRFEVAVRPDRVEASFTDDGPPAEVDLAAVAMPDPLADRGRGLALARQVLDELTYRREGPHNHWTLTHLLG
ncbi:ATP-binding protein [Nocardia sp. NPDC050697]|uniref:ATP-binding protein n=1 Tax=Nocardia sp. NPDC050697 TaxID=3155158 RepID=UPI0033E42248